MRSPRNKQLLHVVIPQQGLWIYVINPLGYAR